MGKTKREWKAGTSIRKVNPVAAPILDEGLMRPLVRESSVGVMETIEKIEKQQARLTEMLTGLGTIMQPILIDTPLIEGSATLKKPDESILSSKLENISNLLTVQVAYVDSIISLTDL
jgi:hypothetical protein